jgi:hypothetical protein
MASSRTMILPPNLRMRNVGVTVGLNADTHKVLRLTLPPNYVTAILIAWAFSAVVELWNDGRTINAI